jgi:hypothetical protein
MNVGWWDGSAGKSTRLLFRRSRVQIPATTWWLTTILNKIWHPLLECLKTATVYLHIIINKSLKKNECKKKKCEYVRVCVRMCAFVCASVYLNVWVWECICLCVAVCASVYSNVWVCVNVCICVCKCVFKCVCVPGVVAHAFNPSTWEAEVGGFLSSRPA